MTSETLLNIEKSKFLSAGIDKPNQWIQSALETLSRLIALPTNWDGYGSPPLGAKEAEHAILILKSVKGENLPEPNIAPVHGGGIQLEWYHCGRELELEIVPGEDELIFLKVYEDERMEEGAYPPADLDEIRKLIKWLLNG